MLSFRETAILAPITAISIYMFLLLVSELVPSWRVYRVLLYLPRNVPYLKLLLVSTVVAAVLATLGVGVYALVHESRQALGLSVAILAVGTAGLATANCLIRIFSVTIKNVRGR